MPYKPLPNYKSEPEKMFEVPTPAMGGINLRDLEFEQEPSQSPYMLNVMYRNGAFGKRYGQEVYATFTDELYSAVYYDGSIFVHSGTKIYQYDSGSTEVASGMPEESGMFIVYAQKLYYLISSGFYVFDKDDGEFKDVEGYIPDLFINCEPNGSHADGLDELNLMSDQFSYIYNADGTAVYDVGIYDSEDIIDWDEDADHKHPQIKVYYDDFDTPLTEGTDYTVDSSTKKITFTTSPLEGSLNVKITVTMKPGTFSVERGQILSCKFYDTFGGSNNSRLFVAGCGYSKYFYTQAYDISYFPESNFATLGNTEDDITGFGRQYNVLIVFKPREVYSIYSYTQTSTTTVMEEQLGLEAFKSQLVNASIGCDAPHSIQLINNLLTWFNSTEGVCTLVSTNIQDERNVRVISRNIDYTNNFGVKGILDYDEDLNTIQSTDYNNRYFLVFPSSGMCFMWDYEIQPYVVTSRGDTDPRKLDWFLFDKFYVKQFLKVDKQLLYISNYDDTRTFSFTNLIENGDFMDDFNGWEYSRFVRVPNINDDEEITDYIAQGTSNSYGSYGYLRQTVSTIPGHKYYISYYAWVSSHMHLRTPLGTLEHEPTSPKRYSDIITSYGDEYEFDVSFIHDIKGQGLIDVATGSVRKVMMFDVTSMDATKEQLDELVDHYISSETITKTYADYTKSLIKLNKSFVDVDFNGDSVADPIHAYYMTPFMQFGAVEWLKNVRNIYVQCRGDVNSIINLYYYTDYSEDGEPESYPIEVGGKGVLWDKFTWGNMVWKINSWAKTMRRRCNLRHVQMCAVYCENDEPNSDMSITHVGFQYSMVKNIK